MKSVTLHGLRNCDTCRRAARALAAAGAEVTLRDLRADPVPRQTLADWIAVFGDALVNRRSTTWRGLGAEARAADTVDLLAAHPALIKRPVTASGGGLWLGWDAATADQVLAALREG